MAVAAWVFFLVSAVFEVGGDALIRMGLRSGGTILILLGFTVLGSYGLIVNAVEWQFSKTFGVYVCVFAPVSLLFGRFVFREAIPTSSWFGLGSGIAGGLVIQFGA